MKPITPFIILAIALLLSGVVLAAGTDYDVNRGTAAGGGGTSSGGAYALTGTTGQAAAGALAGGDFALGSGLWSQVSPVRERIYLPRLVRPSL